jgi:hypothetical protein
MITWYRNWIAQTIRWRNTHFLISVSSRHRKQSPSRQSLLGSLYSALSFLVLHVYLWPRSIINLLYLTFLLHSFRSLYTSSSIRKSGFSSESLFVVWNRFSDAFPHWIRLYQAHCFASKIITQGLAVARVPPTYPGHQSPLRCPFLAPQVIP